jgi:hypothetical protein
MGSGPVRKPSADDQLMRAFGNGDEAALQELFIRFGPDVYGIGRRCFLDADLAEAFVARTFITMWHRSSQYTSSSMPLETWVVGQALAVALQMSASHPGGSADPRSVDGPRPMVVSPLWRELARVGVRLPSRGGRGPIGASFALRAEGQSLESARIAGQARAIGPEAPGGDRSSLMTRKSVSQTERLDCLDG